MINVLFQKFQSYNQFDLLRNEGLYQGPGQTKVHLNLFLLPLKKLIFLLLLWSALKNWLVWIDDFNHNFCTYTSEISSCQGRNQYIDEKKYSILMHNLGHTFLFSSKHLFFINVTLHYPNQKDFKNVFLSFAIYVP